MTDDDQLLDDIIARLRSEPVPEMPAELAGDRVARRRGWTWRAAAAAAALSATAASFLVWQWLTPPEPTAQRPPEVAQRIEDPPQAKAVMLDVDLTKRLVRLEQELDAIDAEVAELRVQAARLDARRKADELLAGY